MIATIVKDNILKGFAIAALGMACLSHTNIKLGATLNLGVLTGGAVIGTAIGLNKADRAVAELKNQLTGTE